MSDPHVNLAAQQFASGAMGNNHGEGGMPIANSEHCGLGDGPGIGSASLFPDILHGGMDSTTQGFSGTFDSLIKEAVGDANWLSQSPTPANMLGNMAPASLQGAGVINKDMANGLKIYPVSPQEGFNAGEAHGLNTLRNLSTEQGMAH